MLLYYITDRRAFPGDEPSRYHQLLDKIAEAASAGVDYVQLREKDLSVRDLELLAREAMQVILNRQLKTGNRKPGTALLVNSRTDVALAAKGTGVHLRSSDISPEEVRKIWRQCESSDPSHELTAQNPLITVSCHSVEEVKQAAANQAALAVFAPVFEKRDSPGTTPAGLEGLRGACRAKIRVIALGGVTVQNARLCIQAGAAGIAAIRLFQENDIATIVHQLRE